MQKLLLTLLLIPLSLPGQTTSWVYDTSDDDFSENAVLDLRSLNEDVAGENGWVYREGGQLFTPDGKLMRFWGTQSDEHDVRLEDHARFLAKMGVNLVRGHGPNVPINENTAESLADTDPDIIDTYWRKHAALKAEGIYSVLHFYFVLNLNIRPGWNVPGYTQEFIDGREVKPFAVFMWEPVFKDAYKQWLRDIFGPTNPYTGLSLAQDPAVAMIELQNEDSFFFWTFNVADYPEIQRQKLEGLFYDWLLERYGSAELAHAAWGDYNPGSFGRDAPANGRYEVKGVSTLTSDDSYTSLEERNRRRLADQIQFLAELQIEFFNEGTAVLRDELGYQGLIIAGNWRTADFWNLEDIERYTYTAGDVIDRHNYFTPPVLEGALFPSTGTLWYSVPLVQLPRSSPAMYKSVEGHPHITSESAWVSLHDFKVEGAPAIAALTSMAGMDGFLFFTASNPTWNLTWEQFNTAVPDVIGQFPAAAIMARRSYLDEAPAVVREGRSPRNMYMRNRTIIPIETGFDVARDDPDIWNPEISGAPIDSIANFAGRVDIAFDTDDDFIHPELPELISIDDQQVTSVTGEVFLDWGKGLLTINSARAQGAVGFLSEERRITLDHVRISSENDFGSILIVSMDDRPLTQADRVLIQAGGQASLTNQVSIPWQTTWQNQPVTGFEAVDLGTQPWRMEDIQGNIILFDERTITDIQVLDTKGYYRESITPSEGSGGQRVDLLEDAVYYVVNFETPANYTPVIYTKSTQNARIDEPFEEQLRAFEADGSLTWSATGLPTGLTLNASGLLSGTPTQSGLFTPDVTVIDTDGDSVSQTVKIAVIDDLRPLDLWSDLPDFDGFKRTAFGWIGGLEHYPYLYSYAFESWLYVLDRSSTLTNLTFYIFERDTWAWTSETYNGWWFDYPTQIWSDITPEP